MIKWLIIFIGISSFAVASKEVVTMCVDHYPPYQVVSGQQKVTGISVEFAQRLVDRLNASLSVTIEDSLDDCLRLAARGETDLVVGLHASKSRANIFDLFQYSDGYSNTLFVTRVDGPTVQQLSDLYGKKVGVIKAYEYFADFDNERDKIKKVVAEHIGQLVFELQQKSVDAIAVSMHQWQSVRDIVSVQGQFRVAQYHQVNPRPVHLGLAKNGSWRGDREVFRNIVDRMYQEKEVEKLIKQHFLTGKKDRYAEQSPAYTSDEELY